jgi:hypothetical protein
MKTKKEIKKVLETHFRNESFMFPKKVSEFLSKMEKPRCFHGIVYTLCVKTKSTYNIKSNKT